MNGIATTMPEGNGKWRNELKISFGEVLILLSVIFGLVFQYLNFSVQMSNFEGYTRAKIESIDCELKRINKTVEDSINRNRQ